MTVRPAPIDELALSIPARPDAAAVAGRALAGRQVPAAVVNGADPVEAAVRAAIPELQRMGIEVEVVRSRQGCIVVRSIARTPGMALQACVLVDAWLDALPTTLHGVTGTVAESTCAVRGARRCLRALMWRADGTTPIVAGPLPTDETAGARPGPGDDAVAPGREPPAPDETVPIDGVDPFADGSPVDAVLLDDVLVDEVLLDGVLVDEEPVAVPTSHTGAGNGGGPGGTGRPGGPGAPGGPGRSGPGMALDATTVVPLVRANDDVIEIDADLPVARAAGRSVRRFAWVRRRAWLLVIGLLAGAVGGAVASTHGPISYSATTVLVVQSKVSTVATSSADGAEELAVTYAALIPDDQALLERIGTETGMSPATVGRHLSVQAESGTALIEIHVSGADPATAVHDANDVANALTSPSPPGKAIVPGSVNVVSPARAASRSGSLHKYGLPLGVLLGLLVGSGAALVAERTDRRVDDLDSLGDAAGCSATMSPGGISPGELARALDRTGSEVAVVPLRARHSAAARRLALAVLDAWRPAAHGSGRRPTVVATPPFEEAPESLSDGSGTTVLVVGSGERWDAVREAAERLRLLGRPPAWAVLVPAGGAGPAGNRGR